MNSEDFALKVGKGAAYIFGGTAIGYIISFFYKIILARFLGPHDFGTLSIILTVITFLSMLSLGIPAAVTKYISEKNSKRKIIFKTSMTMVLFISTIVLFVLIFSADYISYNIFGIESSLPLKIASGVLFVTILQSVIASVIAGLQQMRDAATSEIIDKSIKVVATVALLYMGLGIVGVIIGTFIGAAVSIFYLSTRLPKGIQDGKFDKKYAGKMIIFGFPIFLGIVGSTILSSTDTFILGLLTEERLVGLYNAALPIMWYLAIPIAALSASLFPALSQISSGGHKTLLTRMLNRSVKYTVYILLPAVVGVIMLSEYVIIALYGPSFIEASVVLRILSIGAFMSALSSILGIYLSGIGKPKYIMYSVLTAAVFNVIISWFMISRYGLNGAGVATVVSNLLMVGLLLINTRRFERIDVGCLWKPVLSTALMVIPVYLVLLLDMRSLLTIPISVVVGAVTYFASMHALNAFDRFDKFIFMRADNKIKRLLKIV